MVDLSRPALNIQVISEPSANAVERSCDQNDPERMADFLVSRAAGESQTAVGGCPLPFVIPLQKLVTSLRTME